MVNRLNNVANIVIYFYSYCHFVGLLCAVRALPITPNYTKLPHTFAYIRLVERAEVDG